MGKARMQLMIKQVYDPKFQVKQFSPFMYRGQSEGRHVPQRKYNTVQQKDFIFGVKDRSEREALGVILGLSSTGNKSHACLMDSMGQIHHKNDSGEQPDKDATFEEIFDKKLREEKILQHQMKWLP